MTFPKAHLSTTSEVDGPALCKSKRGYSVPLTNFLQVDYFNRCSKCNDLNHKQGS